MFLTVDVRIMAAARQMRLTNKLTPSLVLTTRVRHELPCEQWDQTRPFRISASRTQAQCRYVFSIKPPFLLAPFFWGVRKCRNFPTQKVFVLLLKLLLVVGFGNVSYFEVAFR